VDPAKPLLQDLFVPGSMPPPKNVSLEPLQ
jgi:hypothetical protein